MKHIIIIGFKNTGKSVVGERLGRELRRPFVDLDRLTEQLHQKETGEKKSVREIMTVHGEKYFRKLEVRALKATLSKPGSLVVAVGGGTPMSPVANKLIKKHIVVLVYGNPDIVFKRIMKGGLPAYFPKKGNKRIFFNKIFRERQEVFERMAKIRVDNTGKISDSVKKILKEFEKRDGEKTILLVHGPNLNFLGRRDSHHYGNMTLKELEKRVVEEGKRFRIRIKSFQSNHEGYLIDYIQKNSSKASGIIINPGALNHYSYALHDALLDCRLPVIEVHLSKVNTRESWRKKSVIRPVCRGVFSGEKEKSYRKAVVAMDKIINSA